MREIQVLVVTVDETKERLVGHFADLLSDRLEVRRRLTEGHPLPDLSRTTEGDLANMAQESTCSDPPRRATTWSAGWS